MQKRCIRLHVNEAWREVAALPNKLLLDVLREDLGLTGTKRGCDDSSCGACTVLLNGEPMMSCLMLAVSYAAGESPESRRDAAADLEFRITTIEGVARGTELHPLQIGFCVEGGAQCGYCTPGIILTAKWLLDRNPSPTDQEINEALSGNLCRCTGYTQILESVRRAIDLLRARAAPEPVEVARP